MIASFILLFAILFCCCVFGSEPTCDAYEFGLSPSSQRYPCLFPFTNRNGSHTYVNECMPDGEKMVCPIYVPVGNRRIIREGICKCTRDGIYHSFHLSLLCLFDMHFNII